MEVKTRLKAIMNSKITANSHVAAPGRRTDTGALRGQCQDAPRSGPELFGIIAFGDEAAYAFDDERPVFAVGDAEPGVGGPQHFHAREAGGGQVVDGGGNVKLGFFLVAMLGEEGDHLLLQMPENVRRKAPDVHGNRFVAGERVDLPGGIGVLGGGTVLLDFGEFGDAFEVAGGGDLADSARDAAELGEGVAQDEPDHGVIGSAGTEMVGEQAVGIGAVKVVGIDGGEGAGNGVGSHEDGVGGAPGFLTPGRRGETGREFVEFLEDEFDGHALFEAAANGLLERIGHALANDEHDLAETGAEGVEDGIVEDGFAARADGVDLFEAAVAAAHAGGEDE